MAITKAGPGHRALLSASGQGCYVRCLLRPNADNVDSTARASFGQQSSSPTRNTVTRLESHLRDRLDMPQEVSSCLPNILILPEYTS